MRFFLLSSLVVLGLINVCVPVQVEIYASHCALDRSLLQVKGFQVRTADLPEAEEQEDLSEEQESFARKGLEALARPWMQKLRWLQE
ncbi:hypothetical protein TH61_08190 [Rufibacter sp. DG15C]|uniref:hypothetical protein n=1 Tax=Rufibacter sp. DG15C TaxID=1379909 RepID=UPI00078B4A77|nr:hypothetical protein [Rufibacter sp. DG15C]AMM51161.1 hypothetical protein TH61_08190 [Rufibacter sp. DG15C]